MDNLLAVAVNYFKDKVSNVLDRYPTSDSTLEERTQTRVINKYHDLRTPLRYIVLQRLGLDVGKQKVYDQHLYEERIKKEKSDMEDLITKLHNYSNTLESLTDEEKIAMSVDTQMGISVKNNKLLNTFRSVCEKECRIKYYNDKHKLKTCLKISGNEMIFEGFVHYDYYD